MKHLGDITQIDWSKVEPTDVVTGGSPCQDLSIAGKREGLAGERSGLYMEQIKCWRELRNADIRRGRTAESIRPRWGIWENVPGAFSSNKGEDFAAVLTEAIRVVEPSCPDVPVPESGWPYSGYIYDDMGKWSVAWRTHDAQYWGVPQHRRRISLVVDFGGLSAAEVLFKSDSLQGDSSESRTAGKEIAGGAGKSSGSSEPIPINTMVATRWNALGRGTGFGVGKPGDAAYTISAGHEHAIFSFEPGILKRQGDHYYKDVGGTLRANAGDNQLAVAFDDKSDKPVWSINHAIATGGSNTPYVATKPDAYYLDTTHADDVVRLDETVAPLQARDYKGGKLVAFAQNQRDEVRDLKDIAGALAAEPGMKQQTYIYESHPADSRVKELDDVSPTMSVKWAKGAADTPLVCKSAAANDQTIFCMATQQGGAEVRDDNKAPTLTAAAGMSGNNQPVVCLNDQGGSVMSTSEEVTATLRAQEHGHQPVICKSDIGCDLYNGQVTGDKACTLTASEAVKNASGPSVMHKSYCIQGNSIDRADTAGCNGKGVKEEVAYSLNTIDRHAVYDARGNGDGKIVPTLTGDHENRITDYSALCLHSSAETYQKVTGPLMANSHPGSYSGQDAYTDMFVTQSAYGVDCRNSTEDAEKTAAFQASASHNLNSGNVVRQTYGICSYESNAMKSDNPHSGVYKADTSRTLDVNGGNPACHQGGMAVVESETNVCFEPGICKREGGHTYENISGTLRANAGDNQMAIAHACTVRRLTPLECERLQGFPDHWTDIGEWYDSNGKKHKDADSPRYKALGNSIALPFWYWLLGNISRTYPDGYIPTLGSLFDGISGFPLCWELINGRNTAKWTSEIEEFPIAVCKKHFGDEDAGIQGDLDEVLGEKNYMKGGQSEDRSD